MTDNITLWDKIHNDLIDNGELSSYKVNVYELTSHLKILYNKIEELENQIENLKWGQLRDFECDIEDLKDKTRNL